MHTDLMLSTTPGCRSPTKSIRSLFLSKVLQAPPLLKFMQINAQLSDVYSDKETMQQTGKKLSLRRRGNSDDS